MRDNACRQGVCASARIARHAVTIKEDARNFVVRLLHIKTCTSTNFTFFSPFIFLLRFDNS